MSEKFIWDAPPLDAEDARLVDAYQGLGKALDDLPYTAEFDALVKRLGVEDTLERKHSVFKRLLALRKMGRLPRVSI